MSFAIIETGGKQYKVTASKILEIEKLNAKVGETIKFDLVYSCPQYIFVSDGSFLILFKELNISS